MRTAKRILLARVLAKAVADYLYYFHTLELSERQRQKLRDEWIKPTLDEYA